MKHGRRIADSRADSIFYCVNAFLITLFFIIILYPMLYIFSASISEADAVVAGKVFIWPVGFSLEGYEAVFKHSLIGRSFLNSLVYTALSTAISVVCTLLAAYPLSRRDFQAQRPFMFLLVFTMLFSGGLVPDYLLVKDLGLMNTTWALLLPGAISAYNVIITRTFFQGNIPRELLEAAQIDTCSDYRFFAQIALPLSAPVIGVIALFYAVGRWNGWFDAMIYLNEPVRYPLQLVLRDILILNEMDSKMIGTNVQELAEKQNLRYLLKYSVIIVASLPVMAIYPFVQKYFVQGVMVGSLKG